MKKFFLIAMTVLALLGLMAGPIAAAKLSGSVSIYTAAACKDTATVAASGSSEWATNRIRVNVYKQDSKGNTIWLARATS